MITIEQSTGRIDATVFGEFTLADSKEFEELVNYKLKFEGQIDLLFDLRAMSGFTVDAAMEDFRYTRAHARDFRRVAVLTDSQWLSWSAWLSHMMVDSELQSFSDEAEAEAWLAAAEEETEDSAS